MMADVKVEAVLAEKVNVSVFKLSSTASNSYEELHISMNSVF